MNEAMQNLLTRRAVRAYKADPVPKDVLERVVEAGLYAPSGHGRQCAVILAVTDRAVRDRLSRANAAVMGADFDPFYGAPVVLVVLADRSVPTCVEDGALVMGNLMNAAHAEGLGSCWIHRAREVFAAQEGQALLKSVGLEGDYVGVGHCILGYPADPLPEAEPRRPGRVFWIE